MQILIHYTNNHDLYEQVVSWKGNRALAEVGWGEEDRIRPSSSALIAMERIIGIYTLYIPSEEL